MKSADQLELEAAKIPSDDKIGFQTKFNEFVNNTENIKFVTKFIKLEPTAEIVKRSVGKEKVDTF